MNEVMDFGKMDSGFSERQQSWWIPDKILIENFIERRPAYEFSSKDRAQLSQPS